MDYLLKNALIGLLEKMTEALAHWMSYYRG